MAIKRKFPPRVATVYCSGGCRAKKDEDGALLCAYGCRFDAIHLSEFGCAEVDDEKCIGCGACAVVCPRHVIKDRFGVLTPVH